MHKVVRSFVATGFFLVLLFSISCRDKKEKSSFETNLPEVAKKLVDVDQSLAQALKQMELQVAYAEKENRIPRTVTTEGEMHWVHTKFDWTAGFFPGSLRYVYKLTKDEKWKEAAESFQAQFEAQKYLTGYHVWVSFLIAPMAMVSN